MPGQPGLPSGSRAPGSAPGAGASAGSDVGGAEPGQGVCGSGHHCGTAPQDCHPRDPLKKECVFARCLRSSYFQSAGPGCQVGSCGILGCAPVGPAGGWVHESDWAAMTGVEGPLRGCDTDVRDECPGRTSRPFSLWPPVFCRVGMGLKAHPFPQEASVGVGLPHRCGPGRGPVHLGEPGRAGQRQSWGRHPLRKAPFKLLQNPVLHLYL